MLQKYKDKNWLSYQYLVLEKSIRDIARECNVHRTVIKYFLKKLQIPIRSQKTAIGLPHVRAKISEGNRGKVRITKNCTTCGKEIKVQRCISKKYHHHFCDRTCWIQFMKLPKPNRKTGKTVSCPTCGKLLYVPKNRFKKVSEIYCSPKCSGNSPTVMAKLFATRFYLPNDELTSEMIKTKIQLIKFQRSLQNEQ